MHFLLWHRNLAKPFAWFIVFSILTGTALPHPAESRSNLSTPKFNALDQIVATSETGNHSNAKSSTETHFLQHPEFSFEADPFSQELSTSESLFVSGSERNTFYFLTTINAP